ncbi:MAG TPA: molybdopterin molybdotransferase MoeA [Bacillota bacterium]|nr:molybdopterin molybdotransferase MoeA [Bacillota bacterium]
MSLFLSLTPRAEAWDKFKQYIKVGPHESETVNICDAIDCILAEDIISPADLPGFARSTKDGYAVRASSTFGASQGLPALLTLRGRIRMGEQTKLSLGQHECAAIATGGMVPEGADAVVMIEMCEAIDDETIAVTHSVAPGENVVGAKEDIASGTLMLSQGRRLRPPDIAALAAMGVPEVKVAVGPKVAVISTGDELVDIWDTPLPGQVRDMNAYSIYSAIKACGGRPKLWGIVKDESLAIQEIIAKAHRESDMVIVSGGSSIGERDFTRESIEALGDPGVLIHGVAIKPGKPTILAVAEGKPVFGLPGHPMSSLVVFNLFVAPAIAMWMGGTLFRRETQARLSANVASIIGREDYVSVKLRIEDGEVWADPVFTKSAAISGLVCADGIMRIPDDVEGVEKGDRIRVTLF